MTMNGIIIYGSKYGSTKYYAEKLSERTGLPAVSYNKHPEFKDRNIIIYMGGLYAGGVLGLSSTFRNFTLSDKQKLIIVTVGVSDPNQQSVISDIQNSMKDQISNQLFRRAEIYHLRGKIDYQNLSLSHRAMMALMHKSLKSVPYENQTAENQAFLDTYGKEADFTDLAFLNPIIEEINRN